MHPWITNLLGLVAGFFLLVASLCLVAFVCAIIDYVKWLKDDEWDDGEPTDPAPEPVDPSDIWKHPRLSGRN